MTNVVYMDQAYIEGREAELLQQLGMSQQEFREYELTHTLTGEPWEILEELRGIWFLLGKE